MYLDSCILVKLFVREPDSDFFGKLTDGRNLSSSILAFTEVWAALLAKQRNGGITMDQRQRAWRAFERNVDEEMILLVPFSTAVLKKANHLMEGCHPQIHLCSLDALHLASCDQLQDWPLCTTDKRMRDAAALLRFPISDFPSLTPQ